MLLDNFKETKLREDPATDIDNGVMAVLQSRVGKGRAVGRDQLVHAVALWVDREEKIDDRMVRLAIERLRQTSRGSLIMSSPGWAGYWMAADYAEIEELYDRERSRSLTLMSRIRKQRDLANLHFEVEPQMGLLGLYGLEDE